MTVIAYVRVSTEKQNIANQHHELENFTLKNTIQIDEWLEETISSCKALEKRALGRRLKKMQKGDILITCELSRLGRNLLEVMSILQTCLQKDCQIWTIKENYRLGADIQSKVLAFAFGLSAEIERQLISQRTKEALARIKAEGKKLGRKPGTKNKHHKLEGKEATIKALLASGLTRNKIAKKLKTSFFTVNKYVKYNNFA
ncbi:MAG: master DNA invertase Mpi family serine-type recombinase [Alphaproteobacteria bacterium]